MFLAAEHDRLVQGDGRNAVESGGHRGESALVLTTSYSRSNHMEAMSEGKSAALGQWASFASADKAMSRKRVGRLVLAGNLVWVQHIAFNKTFAM